jgi:hypothetical protein
MNAGFPVRLTSETAAELCRRVEISESARVLLRDGQTPREFLDLLVDGRHHLDAVRWIAHSLPPRESIYWASQCARMAHSGTENEAARHALDSIDAWLLDPSDANRRACMPAAEAAGLGTPAGCSCASVFFSGGSLAPPNVQAVPPGEFTYAQFVAGAVAMSAVFTEPEHAPDKQRQHLALGRKIIDGSAAPPLPSANQPAPQAANPLSQVESSTPPTQDGGPAPKRPSLFF